MKIKTFKPDQVADETQPETSILFQSICANEREILEILQTRCTQDYNRNIKFCGQKILHVLAGAKINTKFADIDEKGYDALEQHVKDPKTNVDERNSDGETPSRLPQNM